MILFQDSGCIAFASRNAAYRNDRASRWPCDCRQRWRSRSPQRGTCYASVKSVVRRTVLRPASVCRYAWIIHGLASSLLPCFANGIFPYNSNARVRRGLTVTRKSSEERPSDDPKLLGGRSNTEIWEVGSEPEGTQAISYPVCHAILGLGDSWCPW